MPSAFVRSPRTCSGSTPRGLKSCRTGSITPSFRPREHPVSRSFSIPPGSGRTRPRTASGSFELLELSSRADPRPTGAGTEALGRPLGVSARGVVPEPDSWISTGARRVWSSRASMRGLERRRWRRWLAERPSLHRPRARCPRCAAKRQFSSIPTMLGRSSPIGEALDNSDVLSALGLAPAARFTWSACADGHAEAYCQAANFFQTGLDRAR